MVETISSSFLKPEKDILVPFSYCLGAAKNADIDSVLVFTVLCSPRPFCFDTCVGHDFYENSSIFYTNNRQKSNKKAIQNRIDLLIECWTVFYGFLASF